MANAYERHDISDESWAKIEFLLPGRKGTWGGNHTNDMIYRMNLGLKSNFCYRGARELGAATLATTGNLSMRYFGFYERGHLGVICHRVTEIGKILTGVFAVGVTKEFGRNYCRN